jgi:hypothetical protein
MKYRLRSWHSNVIEDTDGRTLCTAASAKEAQLILDALRGGRDNKEDDSTWTHEDQRRALAQGWGVFDNGDHGLRIERHDEMARFDCDAAAVAYVAHLAVLGDPLARKAIEHLAWEHAVMDAAECDAGRN